MINIVVNEGLISFSLEKSLYNIDTLYKCFYWYSNGFDLEISEPDNGFYQIKLERKDLNIEFEEKSILSKIKQDLVDFKLRDIISKETKNIRDLLVAKAFAHYENNNPQTVVSDPVGFNPENII